MRAKEKAQVDGNNEESDRKYEDVDPHGESIWSPGLKRATQHLDMGDHVLVYPEQNEESCPDASYTPADTNGDGDIDAPGFCHKVRGHVVEMWKKVKSSIILRLILGCGILAVAVMFITEGVSPGTLIPNRQNGMAIDEKVEKPNDPWCTASYKGNRSEVAYPTSPTSPPMSSTMWQTESYENTSVVVTVITLSSPLGWKSTEPRSDTAATSAKDGASPVTPTLLSKTGTDMSEKCIGDPCQHGTCVNKDVGYKCTCYHGRTGQNCQQCEFEP
ncbi:Hypp9275 [Branchiostoma lanceolatum]|uniref:Hypp9275 protein n=1 Tax=Branchiostoma lanceolatum TaxID=7740 RepID=A0A8J9ZEC9_BRALA|nr:Hypp9275 [Branchiostoma lanceolatum]